MSIFRRLAFASWLAVFVLSLSGCVSDYQTDAVVSVPDDSVVVEQVVEEPEADPVVEEEVVVAPKATVQTKAAVAPVVEVEQSVTTTTYEEPKPVYTPPATYDTYTNVDGNEIQSPTYYPSAPAGATAQCGDGSYSFSQHRSGTCSHHGGVASWL